MKAVGIITEYNPLHDGHILHINESRKLSGADVVVCIMSGDYVQRGEPAIIDKYSRTKMAVLSGADLVIELPVEACLSSAEGFADAAVSQLARLNVSSICFGCESADILRLSHLADILSDESEEFKRNLSYMLENGESYAAARQKAIELTVGSDVSSLLSTPNNILGTEYIKAIKKHNYNIEALCIQRTGCGYNDGMIKENEIPSATAVRNVIMTGNPEDILLPETTKKILNESVTYPIVFNDFTELFYYKLEGMLFSAEYNKEGFIGTLLRYKDMTSQIAGRIYNIYTEMNLSGDRLNLGDFAMAVKTKQYALSRIKRSIMRIILDTDKSHNSDKCDYLRILGFNQIGRKYLSNIRESVDVPMITKVADYRDIYSEQIHAHNIYRQICISKYGSAPVSDYKYKPYII